MDVNFCFSISRTSPNVPRSVGSITKHTFDNFFEILDGAVNKVFPETLIKVHKFNSPLNPWMTTGLLTSRKRKEKLASKKLRNPTILAMNNFKSYNKINNSLKRNAKQNYYDSKFTEFSTNMRKTWETIREVIRKKNTGKTFLISLNIMAIL